MEKTVVELFAGVGGFRCGLNNVELVNDKVIEHGNWNFVWANQWEPSTKIQHAFDCYNKRFGESKNHSNEDITKVDKKTIPNHTLLVGGFPCQDYSVARTLSSEKGIEGKKGVLWWDIAEILKVKKPPFVLLENVDRLLISPSKQRGRDFGIMLRTFANNGYAVEWRVINASDYGFAQKRRRVFIFAYRNSTNYFKKTKKQNFKNIIFQDGIFAKAFPILNEYDKESTCDISKKVYPDLVELSNNFKGDFYNAGFMKDYIINSFKTKSITEPILPLKNIIEKNGVDDKFYISERFVEKLEYLKGSKRIRRFRPNGEPYFYSEGNMDFPDSLEKPARTMLTSESSVNRSSHIISDPITNKLRIITPIEAERINGFPDNWTNTGMPDKRRYFMMGNALVVGIIRRLNHYIEGIVDNEE